jgi:hypothetical protein
MKKILIIIMLATLSVAGMASANTILRYVSIPKGFTMLSRPMVFSTADSLVTGKGFHIVASDSLVIYVTNPQQYLQYQTVTTTLANANAGASPTITITVSGRTTSTGTWYQIGTQTSWTSISNNPVNITGTTALNYNYLKIRYVMNATSGGVVKILTCDVKTANVFPYGAIAISGLITGTAGATITGAAVSLNAGSNYAVNIGTGNSTGTVTVGGTGIQSIAIGNGAAAKTVALGSSNSTSTTTILSGSNGVNINASNNQPTNINTGSSTGLVTIGGGSGTAAINTSAWGITSAGAMSGFTTAAFSGAISANGGIVVSGFGPVVWAKGGPVALATSGTDKACANGTRFWVSIDIPYNVSLTGVAYLVGSVGGTDSVVVQLCNSSGVEVATSKMTGLHHGAIVGTAAQFQSCPFYVGATPTAYTAASGKYFIVVQFNGTTAKFRTYPIPGCKFIAGSVAGTWDTKANITPGSSFTVDVGPIAMTY